MLENGLIHVFTEVHFEGENQYFRTVRWLGSSKMWILITIPIMVSTFNIDCGFTNWTLITRECRICNNDFRFNFKHIRLVSMHSIPKLLTEAYNFQMKW